MKCQICKQENTNDLDKTNDYISFPAGAKFKDGYANVAFHLSCGHWMLDDKTDRCPRFVKEV